MPQDGVLTRGDFGKPVFVHVSKNAGTSIIATAGDRIEVAGHQPAARWVARHSAQSPMFAVVRDPYDRVRSEYRYRRGRYLSGDRNPHLANLHLPFDRWVSATYGDGHYRTPEFFEITGIPYDRQNLVDGQLVWFAPQARCRSGERSERGETKPGKTSGA